MTSRKTASRNLTDEERKEYQECYSVLIDEIEDLIFSLIQVKNRYKLSSEYQNGLRKVSATVSEELKTDFNLIESRYEDIKDTFSALTAIIAGDYAEYFKDQEEKDGCFRILTKDELRLFKLNNSKITAYEFGTPNKLVLTLSEPEKEAADDN